MVDVNLEELTRKLQDRFTDMLFATIQEYMPANMKPAVISANGISGNFGRFADALTFTDGVTMWTVKANHFLQRDDFAEIARIVKGLGGSYVSAGKNSHFEIPKKA